MTLTPKSIQLQLLSPARDYATGVAAIMAGADAVYIGPEAFGARARAGNSIDDIARLVNFATPYGVRILATVNTLIYDDELTKARDLIRDLYRVGVDAVIVQDLGLLELDLPPIALHASTQCDTRDADKAKLLSQLGFTQIVVARESSLRQIRAMAQSVGDARIEAFVHGALCVSYSGDCRASLVATGRSANRGECAQICRLPFDLIDGRGRKVISQRHLLSLRDMNRLDRLADMADAGVRSFKIEGRLKDPAYVTNVTAAYRAALDKVIEASAGRYCRASLGIADPGFIPNVAKAFNRQFTDYFLDNRPDGDLASLSTPKAVGEPIGTVAKSSSGMQVEAKLSVDVNNGDGITYIAPDGSAGGFRVNRAQGAILRVAQPVSLPHGTRLFRNSDRQFDATIAAATPTRKITVSLTLRAIADNRLVIDGIIDNRLTVSSAITTPLQGAHKPDNGRRIDTLRRLGDTIFQADEVTDNCTGIFVPISVIANLRRQWVDDAMTALRATFRHEAPGHRADKIVVGMPLDRLNPNIANKSAAHIYRQILPEATPLAPALEIDHDAAMQADLRVMTTRYCIRRQLGACLKEGGEAKLPEPLTLKAVGPTYRLKFDCANCRMHVIANPSATPR